MVQDIGIVQRGFFCGASLYSKEFGIRCTNAELKDYCCDWRVFGYVACLNFLKNVPLMVFG